MLKNNLSRMLLVIYFYPAIIMFGLLLGYRPPGIVGIYIDYYHHLIAEALLCYIGGGLVLVFMIQSKHDFSMRLFAVSPAIRMVSLIVTLAAGFLVYQGAFIGAGNRFYESNYGSLITIVVFMGFLTAITYSRYDKYIIFTHVCALVVVSVLGERADALGFLLLYLLTSRTNGVLKGRQMGVGVFAFMAVLFVVWSMIGLARYEHSPLSMSYERLFFNSTALDVLHVYLSSFYYYELNGSNYYPILHEIYSLNPFSDGKGAQSPYAYYNIIKEHIPNVNGGLFVSEGVLVLGPVGVLVYCFLVGLIVRKAQLSDSRLLKSFYILLVVNVFRFMWYGPFYITRSVELFLVCSLLFYLYVNGRGVMSRADMLRVGSS